MQPLTNEAEIEDLQASIIGLAENGVDLRKRGRRFIFQDDLGRIKKKGPQMKTYHIYLFNDMILYTERSHSKRTLTYKYVEHKLLKDILFIDSADSKERQAFEIMHKDEKKRMTFVAKSFLQKITWKHYLEMQIEKCCPTDFSFSGSQDSLINPSSPSRNSWNGSMDIFSIGSALSSSPDFETSDDDRSVTESPSSISHLSRFSDESSASGTESEDIEDIRSDDNDSDSEKGDKCTRSSDGSLVLASASFNTILWWLIYYGDYNDPILIRTFLCSYYPFATPEDLFHNLLQIYDLMVPVPKVLTLRYSLCDTRRRVTAFLKIWLEFYFERDFSLNKRLYEQLLSFLSELKKNDQEQEANLLKITIIRVNKKKLLKMGYGRMSYKELPNRIMNGVPLRMQQVETKFLEWNVNTLAEQFALIEFSMFKAIDLKELCKQAWKGPNPRRTAPNVINLITRFEMVSQWAATEVVMAHTNRQRVAIIEKLIQLAQKSLELRNFNTLMEILGGLNRGSVQRMKKAWEPVGQSYKDIFRALNITMEGQKNFKNYRDQLKKNQFPSLPYLGVFQRDLVFADEVPDRDGDLINFQKIEMVSGTLKTISSYQRVGYPFIKDENLDPMLRRLLAMPEEMLYKHSNSIEPHQ